MMLGRLVVVFATLLAAGSVAAAPTPPPDGFTSRFESPDTSSTVQPDSLFAPVVAATPPLRSRTQRVTSSGHLQSDAVQQSLDGNWRFQLEPTACGRDAADCEGIVGGWFQPDYDDSAWRTLAVPGNFTRQIPVEELGGRNSELPFHYAWYRLRFTIDEPLDPSRQNLRLVFEAVDYEADVWLDGTRLTTHGSHVGTFNPFGLDLPPLQSRGPHVVVVRVRKPLETNYTSCTVLGQPLGFRTILDGTKGLHDSRPGANRADFDPVTLQSLHTGGIVRHVALVASGPVRVDWVFVTALPDTRPGRARVRLAYTVTNLGTKPVDALVATRFTGTGLRKRVGVATRVRLHPGPNRFERIAKLKHVSYWFPGDHPELGLPVLYQAETSAMSRQGHRRRESDGRVDRFGIRSLGLVSDRCEDRFAGTPPKPDCAGGFGPVGPSTPQGQEPAVPYYQLFVNGMRVFLEGTAGIPSLWVASIDHDFAQEFIEDLHAVNASHLNLHDHVAPGVVYDLMDENGVTVVQDFEMIWYVNDSGQLYQCSPGGPDGAPQAIGPDPSLVEPVPDTAAKLVADMVYLLYNHPSVVEWVMHDEPIWSFQELSGGVIAPLAAVADLGKTVDQRTVAVATAIDHTRLVRAAAGVGDNHIYTGFYLCSLYDLIAPDPSRPACSVASGTSFLYPSEFGTESVPFSAKRWMPPDLLFPADPVVRRQTWSDADPNDPDALVPWLQEWAYHAGRLDIIAGWVGSPADYDRFQDFALASQLFQRAFLKAYVEHFRKDRFRATAGLRTFYLRDYWDTAFFGLFDQNHVPTAAAPTVHDAYAPLLVTSEVTKPVFAPGEALHLPVWVVNDPFTDVAGAALDWDIVQVSDNYVLRGVVDSTTGPPTEDPRRMIIPLPFLLPPQPNLTTLTRAGATALGPPLVSGHMTLDVPGDSVSASAGITTVDFTTPDGPEVVRHYVLELRLTQNGTLLASNRHAIVVAADGFDPPVGLSDGVTAYGMSPGRQPLGFTFTMRGLAPGQPVAVDTFGFGGVAQNVAVVPAGIDGTAVATGLPPDEYVVHLPDTDFVLAHVGLVENTDMFLAGD
jgi:beta-mannosidase